MKDWLAGIYRDFSPEWFFRVAGVLTGIVGGLVYISADPEATTLGDSWPLIVLLYVLWGVVELLRLWADPDD